jgi:hypothetical protein
LLVVLPILSDDPCRDNQESCALRAINKSSYFALRTFFIYQERLLGSILALHVTNECPFGNVNALCLGLKQKENLSR